MHEWMNEQMSEWMNELGNDAINEWMSFLVCWPNWKKNHKITTTNKCMTEWMSGWMYEFMNKFNEWMNEWIKEWMNDRVNVWPTHPIPPPSGVQKIILSGMHEFQWANVNLSMEKMDSKTFAGGSYDQDGQKRLRNR